METKNTTVAPQKSETILTFLAIALLAVITELTATPGFKESLGSYATIIVFGMSMLGVWLRKYTTKPLGKIKEPKKQLNPLEKALRDEAEENGLL